MKRKEILVLFLMSLMLILIAGCIGSLTPDVTEVVRYVATDGDNTNDGNEASPWRTIQYALDNIPTLGTIWVKDGDYNGSISLPSDKKIILKSVNGGSFTTIIGDNGSPTVTGSNSSEGTTLEGFTITHNSGATGRGIEILWGYLNINNCNISSNSDAHSGGGIYNLDTLTITASIISNNSDVVYGGGIYNEGTLTITRSIISNNSATNDGGGIYNNGGTLNITEASTISNNSADRSGGGICNNGGTLNITEASTISNNSTTNDGGGICHNYGTLNITEASTISNNSAWSGGGIYSGGTLNITGSIIYNNSVTVYGGGICNYGTLTIITSNIYSNSSSSGGGIYNHSTLDITTSTISHNSAGNGGGICLLGSGTLTIGGSGEEKNTICGNYKSGEEPSLDQQIRDAFGSLYDTYWETNFISASCPL